MQTDKKGVILLADDFVEPSNAEFDAALEVDHTQPFVAPIFSIEEEEEEEVDLDVPVPSTSFVEPSYEEFGEDTTTEIIDQTDALLSVDVTDDADEKISDEDFKIIDTRIEQLRKEQFSEIEEFEKQIKAEIKEGTKTVLGTQIRTPDLREVDQAYDRADKAYNNVKEFLNGPNAIRSGLTDALLSTNLSIQSINRLITTAEFAPVTGLAIAVEDMPEGWKSLKESISKKDFATAALDAGILTLTLAEGIGSTFVAGKSIKTITNAGKKARNKRLEARKITEANKLSAASKAAKETVAANRDLKDQILSEIDAAAGTKLTKEVDGVKMLDPEAARKQGLTVAKDLMGLQYERALKYVGEETFTGDVKKIFKTPTEQTDEVFGEAQIFTGLTDDAEDLVSPLLIPAKLDSIVAVAADLRKTKPELWDDQKTVIDNLYELAANKELRENGEITDLLIDYGISFDDFTLAVVGSGSEAGKILQKLSMIRKADPMSVRASAKAIVESNIAGWWKRVENIRRGGMVSMIKTASRNLMSTVIRSPTEGLVNVMESVLRAGAGGNIGEAVKTAIPFGGRNTWTDSFKHVEYMFRGAETKDTVDYILKRPELMGEWTGMFDTINEIRRKTNGTGKVLPILEKGVDTLNVFNRWQDHMTRRSIFLSKLRQLTKEQYGIDLDKTLDEGGIIELLGNKTTLVPKGKPRFEQLIEQSTRRAMEITYAAPPSTAPFREAASFMTKYGLTTVAPFPRFMFSSMEYMAESSTGIGNVVMRRVLGKTKGPLTDQDRQNISRNLVGAAAIAAAMKMRGYDIRTGESSEPTSADWKDLDMGEGKKMDTTPLFPLRQYLFIGELFARAAKGTLDDWENLAKDAAETFLGSNMRTGTGNVMIDGITGLLNQESDLVGKEKAFKTLGGMLGNYAATFGIPAGQIPEIQRALGYRTSEPKDVATDPMLGEGTFFDNFIRPARQRGLTTIFSPAEEAKLDKRQMLYKETVEKTGFETLANLLFGMRLENKDEEWGDYLTRKGLLDYKIGSRSQIPSIKRKETEVFREYLPMVVELYMDEEDELRKEYKEKTAEEKNLAGKEDSYINDKLIGRLKTDLSTMKTLVKDEALEDVDTLLQAQVEWRRVSKGDRKRARQDYIETFGEEPKYSDEETMRFLIEVAKEGKISYIK